MDRKLIRYTWIVAAGVLAVGMMACDPEEFDANSPFPHVVHFENELECSMCHEASGEEIGFPVIEDCVSCHDFDPEEGVGKICAECHTVDDSFAEMAEPIHHRGRPGYEAPVPESYADVIFNHEENVEDEEQCLVCHAKMKSEELTAIFLPSMDDSIAFFTDNGNPEPPCSACHEKLARDVKPPSHVRGNWLPEHGLVEAFEGTDTCYYCHTKDSCTTCHEQMQPQNHTALFRLQTHGFEAQWSRETCVTCHREDFCQRCHQEVRPRSHTAGWGGTVNRHCDNCHVEDGEQSSCFTCHTGQFFNVSALSASGQSRVCPLLHAGK